MQPYNQLYTKHKLYNKDTSKHTMRRVAESTYRLLEQAKQGNERRS